MSYQHIDNLYKSRQILTFREVYAMEKVHGTSAALHWNGTEIKLFSGGAKHEHFVHVFDGLSIAENFAAHFSGIRVSVYGEAYGGSMQGMRDTYGDTLRFIAFEVRIDGTWLAVPNAADVVGKLGLEFVPYRLIPTDIAAIDAERDRPSEVAIRRGCGDDKPREGIVLRPPFEVTLNNGKRLVVKHKHDDFRETKSSRPLDVAKLAVLEEADAIADEWVTHMRCAHVIAALAAAGTDVTDLRSTGAFIEAMVRDVLREGTGEFVDTKEARKAIARHAGKMIGVWRSTVFTAGASSVSITADDTEGEPR